MEGLRARVTPWLLLLLSALARHVARETRRPLRAAITRTEVRRALTSDIDQ